VSRVSFLESIQRVRYNAVNAGRSETLCGRTEGRVVSVTTDDSSERLTRFREQVAAARRQAGYLQKDLAAAL
jgi:ribosome-binding protein aMBF1 (putative translation factor)